MDPEKVQLALSIHGAVKIHVIKTIEPCTAFAVFETPKACAEALQQKTMGCNLPRHKRVDFVLNGLAEQQVKEFVEPLADIKQFSTTDGILTIEFLTALGAAKAIVKTKTHMICGTFIQADYSPSIKPDSEITESRDGEHCHDDLGHSDSEIVMKDQPLDSELLTLATLQISPTDTNNSQAMETENDIISLYANLHVA
jgi:hypothetical protein